MGSVEEGSKKDDEAREEGRTHKQPFRVDKALAVTIAVVLLLLFTGAVQYWDSGALCPECAQYAVIDEYRVCGVSVYWETRLRDGVGRAFEADVPGVSDDEPNRYKQIHGVACQHEFIRGGGGRNVACAHFDLGSSVRCEYFPRTGALAALYSALGRVGDEETARDLYGIIDDAYPPRGLDRGDRLDAGDAFLAVMLDENRLPELLADIEAGEEVCSRLERTALTLAEMVLRLRDVETAADFRQVLEEFEPRLKPAVVAE